MIFKDVVCEFIGYVSVQLDVLLSPYSVIDDNSYQNIIFKMFKLNVRFISHSSFKDLMH